MFTYLVNPVRHTILFYVCFNYLLRVIFHFQGLTTVVTCAILPYGNIYGMCLSHRKLFVLIAINRCNYYSRFNDDH